ncbi:MAG: hypothetical protein WBN04_05410 [Paracoccaceae bacterium]
MPNDLGTQSATTGMPLSIIRFWSTRFVTMDGRHVFAPSITPDDRISETAPTPHDIEQARDLLVQQLTDSGQSEVSKATHVDGAISVIEIR